MAAPPSPDEPAAPPAPASALNPFEQQLSKECGSLIAAAVKSSYGWGWADGPEKPAEAAPAPAINPRTGKPYPPPRVKRPVKPVQAIHRDEIDVKQTAAAGLVLQMSGEQLGDPTLTEAAFEAARALAAVQQPTGQMPAIGILGGTGGGHDEPSLVPNREATCASIALMLTVIQSSEMPDARLTAAATKAATWLTTQQVKGGGWPVAYTMPNEKEPTKVIRIDGPAYRDSTAALLLAAHVLGDANVTRRADDAIIQLLLLRIHRGDDAKGVLWVPAYKLTGEPLMKNAELPYALDTVSAQYGMQTLLAACLLGTSAADPTKGITPTAKAAAPALSSAAQMVMKLPKRGTGWHRYYDVLAGTPVTHLEPTGSLIKGDADPLFENVNGEDGAMVADTAVLSEVIAAARTIGSTGLEKYLADAESENVLFWPQHRVTLMLCGLGNGALATQFPQAKAEVAQYVEANEALFAYLDGPTPSNLSNRLERLQLLVIRSKLAGLK